MDNKIGKNLIEPGVKYFFYESLKRCKLKKINYFNTLLNLGLLFLFISIFGIFILYKKKTKISKKEKEKQNIKNLLTHVLKNACKNFMRYFNTIICIFNIF